MMNKVFAYSPGFRTVIIAIAFEAHPPAIVTGVSIADRRVTRCCDSRSGLSLERHLFGSCRTVPHRIIHGRGKLDLAGTEPGAAAIRHGCSNYRPTTILNGGEWIRDENCWFTH